MLSHGGAGSVRTALSAGVPLAVLPRFGDQPLNARAVAGDGRRDWWSRTSARIGERVAALLTDPRYAGVATGIAWEVDSLPPAGEAIAVLRERLAAVT